MADRPIPGELRDVDVQFISLVTKGANGRTFKIFKSADYKGEEQQEPEREQEEVRSFFRLVKNFFTGGGKGEAAKGAREEPEGGSVEVEKVGRKISAARLEKLKAALAALQSVISEVEGETDEGGDEEMNKADLQEMIQKAVQEAVAPLQERIAKLEAETAEAGNGGEKHEEAVTPQDIAKMIGDAVAEALKPIEKRLEVVERARGMSNAVPAENVQKSRGESIWSGIFLP